MLIKKTPGTLLLAGIIAAFGGNALAQPKDSAYELQKSIGADLEIFRVDQAVYSNDGRHLLDFGDSDAQYRDNGNSVFVWYRNPKTDKNEIITQIKDLNGDGIVDVVKIQDLKPSFEEGNIIHRIDNVPGPECVIRGPYRERIGGYDTAHCDMEFAPKKVVPDKDGITPYQRVFDFFKRVSQAYHKK